MNSESARALGWELAHHRDQISEGLRERLEWGLNQPQAALENAYAVFESTQQAFPDAMDGLDVLVTPIRPRRSAQGPGMDRRPGLQLHLDLAARALRHRPRRHRPQRPAARYPDRRPPAATTKPCWPGPAGWKPRLDEPPENPVRRRPAPQLRPHPARLRRPAARHADSARRLRPARRRCAQVLAPAARAGVGQCAGSSATTTPKPRPPTTT